MDDHDILMKIEVNTKAIAVEIGKINGALVKEITFKNYLILALIGIAFGVTTITKYLG